MGARSLERYAPRRAFPFYRHAGRLHGADGLVLADDGGDHRARLDRLHRRHRFPFARLRGADGEPCNSWDTRLGGALADAVSCNTVVKAFGAEGREDARLAKVLRKWENRTRRTWSRGTLNGTAQGAMLLVLRAAVIGFALLLWARGQATAGDITFVLTSFFILQGYLREVGMHIRNLQRSINDMEELVAIHGQPLGVEDRPGAKPIRITEGEIEFRDVTFHYGAHRAPLYEGFSVNIAAGERVGLVGHSGSGKTTFIN